MKKYKSLNLEDRQFIYKMRSLGKGVRETAKLLGRSPSTVSRELKRLKGHKLYNRANVLERAKLAQDDAKLKRVNSRQGYRKPNNMLIQELTILFITKKKFTPEQVSMRLERDYPELYVCSKTIYNYIKSNRKDLIEYLTFKGKPRKSRVCHRRSQFKTGVPTKRSIHAREEVVDSRKEFGHWEMDTIHGKKSGSKKAILSLIERVTRQSYYIMLKDLSSEETRKHLVKFILSLPEGAMKSITVDNGSENALWYEIEKVFKGIKFYFCDAYKSQQKGSVERSNLELRRFYPKGTDWDDVKEKDLEFYTDIINNKPRKVLNGNSPIEDYAFLLGKAA